MSEQAYDPRTAPPYPLQKTLGYEITRWEPGFARVEADVQECHQNVQGIPHGGVYAVLMDTAAAFCGTFTEPGQPSVRVMTLSLTLNFVGAMQGTRMIADARRVGGGKSVFFSEVTLTDETGALIATASATMRYRKKTNARIAGAGA